MVSHLLYGLRLATNRVIPGLPQCENSQGEDVRVRLKTEPAASLCLNLGFGPRQSTYDAPVFSIQTISGSKYFCFVYCDGVRFAVDSTGSEVWGDWPENYALEDACTYFVGPVMGFVLRLRGVVCLHASAVAIDGRAIAIVGGAGAGKSTTAAAFARAGYAVLSDDVVALAEEGKGFLVQPGYPRVNLWPDSAQLLFGSADALPRITPTWTKYYMDLCDAGQRFVSHPLPLGAIYLLGDREENLGNPKIELIRGKDALMKLVSNTYVNYLLDRDMRASEFDLLSRVVARVPIRRVRRSTNPTTIRDVCNAIATDVREPQETEPVAAARTS